MTDELQDIIAQVVQKLYGVAVKPQISLPEAEFGDFTSNVAFELAATLKKAPKAIAEELVEAVQDAKVARAEAAGAGFINIWLTDEALWQRFEAPIAQTLKGKKVVSEYSDPNPFKVLHAGHFYTSVVGDAISNLLESVGAKVFRVNFGGDVGLHVGKAMWGIMRNLGGEHPEKLADIPQSGRADWVAKCYVDGSNAYEDGDEAKAEISQINAKVYAIVADNEHDSDLSRIYWTCRQWSYDYFDDFYDRIGSHFDKYYPESITTPAGLEMVEKGLKKGAFEKSDGAVVFRGERYGLHTRVFLTASGLPTYEAKDLGLNYCKWEDYHFDKSIVITANDITEYMKVVLKAVEALIPEVPPRTTHITHGVVKLAGGVKMSSRKGNILRAVDILEAAKEAATMAVGKASSETVLGAVKYAFLKQRIGGDIIYNPAESVAVEGNSGPYIQYAHARARGILGKADKSSVHNREKALQPDERMLLAKLAEYSSVIEAAVAELMPHQICTYLYDLSQIFNRFYEKNRVVGDEREAVRLSLVQAYADTLKKGLALLGIAAPERV